MILSRRVGLFPSNASYHRSASAFGLMLSAGSRDRVGTAHRNYGLAVRTEVSLQSVKSVILIGIRADAPIEGFSPKSRVSRKPGTRRPASVVRVSFDRPRSSPGS